MRYLLFVVLMSALGSPAAGQLIIAHRGASKDAPENTLAAFRLAIEQGADGFEGDFYLGKDGHVLCFHDKDTARVAGKKLEITKGDFDELRSLDIGSWKDKKWHAERIPTFEEVLEAVPAGKKFFIELKSGPEVVAPIAKIIASSSVAPEQLVVISFNAEAVAESKRLMPHIKALWLCAFKEDRSKPKPPSVEEVARTIKRIHADGLDAEAVPGVVNAKFVKRLSELGCKELNVWTVDDPEVAKFYQELGVWSITTNRPKWLRKKLAE